MEALAGLAGRARALVAGGGRALLGVVGPPGAGKSTLAAALVAAVAAQAPPGWVAHVPMDGFHLADAELDRLGLRGVKGAPETFDVHGYVALLRRLRDGTDPVVYAPAFERTLEQPLAGAVPVPRTARLVVTEGNYLLLRRPGWAAVRPLLDEVWYADLDPAERRRRLVARHERFGKDPAAARAWALGGDERNAALVTATRDAADLLVPEAVLRALRPG